MGTNTQQTPSTREKVIEFLAKEFKTPAVEINDVFFKSDNTMGLSECGHRIMTKVFSFHQFKITQRLLAKHYLGLKGLDYPYYLTEHWLILYNSQDTTMVELYGSANEFLDAYADGV